MYVPEQPENDIVRLPSEELLPKLCSRTEEILRSLQDIEIERLGLEKTRRLVREMRTELEGQHQELCRARLIEMTKDKQTEKELSTLQKSEDRFRKLFERHSAVKLILDEKSGRIIDANHAALQYYGWPREVFTAFYIKDIVELPSHSVEVELKDSGEFRHRRADGSIRDVEVFCNRIETAGNELLYLIVHDITGRKLAEEALRRNEARLREVNEELQRQNQEVMQAWKECKRVEEDLTFANQDLVRRTAELASEKRLLAAIMNALPTGVAINDGSGAITLTNHAFEKIWGKPLPQSRSVKDYVHYKAWWGDSDTPVTPDQWAAARALKGETTIGQIIRIQAFDGAERYILNSASPIYDGEGNIIGGAVATQDITELKRVERALYESEQRLRLFIEHAPVALAMFDREMRYLSASHRWARDLGMYNHNLVGHSAFELHDLPKRWKEAIRRGLTGEVLGEEEDRYRRPDGQVRFMRWKIHPWYDYRKEVGGIVVFTEDITARRQFEEKLRKLNEELEKRVETRTRELQQTQVKFLHAEKLSAIGKLAASIAHEVNNPLMSINIFLRGLRNAQLSPEDREMLDLATSESERLKNLIRNLREFNRPTTGRKTALDVHSALRFTLLLLKSDFRRKKLNVALDLAETLPEISAVADQIKQVLLNLLTNAADACPAGGSIAIRTWQEGDRRIAVAVTDNGIGIESDKIELIFQPFYSTKLESKGTGLGLSICYSIVKEHEGEIRVESKPGEGSTFTVFLPIGEE